MVMPAVAQAATSTDEQIAILQRQLAAQRQQIQHQEQIQQQQQQLLNSLLASREQTKADVAAVKATAAKATAAAAARPSAIPVMSATHKPGWRSADGRNEIDLGALLQVDLGAASYRPEYHGAPTGSGASNPAFQKLTNGWNVRRAQLQASGTFESDFHFALQYDFGGANEQIGGNSAGVSAGFKTALFTYTGLSPFKTSLSLELGYTSPPISVYNGFPGDALPFLEYPTPDRSHFAAGPGIPTLGFRDFTNRHFVYAALAGTRAGGVHDQSANAVTTSPSGTTITTNTGSQMLSAVGRVSVNPVFSKNLKVQTGFGFERTIQPNGNGQSFTDEAEDRVDQTQFIGLTVPGNGRNPVTGAGDWTLETSGELDRFFWTAAYFHYDIERRGLKENDFWGTYGQLLYSITGETHPYLSSSAGWGNIVPAHPFSLKTGGWGAWEVGVRYSYMDMTSTPAAMNAVLPAGQAAQDVLGGHVGQLALGVNWYINSNMLMRLNWMHGVEGGLPGPNRASGYSNVAFYSPTLQNGSKATIYNAHWDEIAARMQFSF